jgi:hypothetical protein
MLYSKTIILSRSAQTDEENLTRCRQFDINGDVRAKRELERKHISSHCNWMDLADDGLSSIECSPFESCSSATRHQVDALSEHFKTPSLTEHFLSFRKSSQAKTPAKQVTAAGCICLTLVNSYPATSNCVFPACMYSYHRVCVHLPASIHVTSIGLNDMQGHRSRTEESIRLTVQTGVAITC